MIFQKQTRLVALTYHSNPVGPLRVRLGHVHVAVRSERDTLRHDQRGLYGQLLVHVQTGPSDRGTVHRSAGDDFQPVVRGQFQYHVVVDDVQSVVQRIDAEVGGPSQVHFAGVERAFARYGFPVRLVHVVADERGHQTVLVHHSDVGAVGKVQDVVRRYGDA